MSTTASWAALAAGARLQPFALERREPRALDVVIEIDFCGVCHSDIHQARGEWSECAFPMVPGHEIVGRVSAIGAGVTRFAPGDRVGVGCMVDSCRACEPCLRGEEQFCESGCAWTYNATEMDRATPTHGGYSRRIVVDEHFVLRIPAGLPPAEAAPLLCAGITTWTPLREWGCGPGVRVAVAGLGGLGHMAVRLAASMGAEVTVLSSHEAKRTDALRLGAHAFEVTAGGSFPTALANRFDLVIDTVSARHDLDAVLGTLRPFGAAVLVGIAPGPASVEAFSLVHGNRRLAGSSIGGIAATQEMLDYCAARGVVPEIERIPIQQVNEAWDRVVRGDVRFRFVIENASLER
jgi:uncharacterized zinc-type alcohol dehydrogenase-like protein